MKLGCKVPCILSCIVQFCQEIWNCIFLVFLFVFHLFFISHFLYSIPTRCKVDPFGATSFYVILKIEKCSGTSVLTPYTFAFFSSSVVIIFSVYHSLNRSWFKAYVWSWMGELSLKKEVQIRISHSGGNIIEMVLFLILCFQAWYCVSLHVISSSLSNITWKWMMVKWIKLVVERVRM